MNSWLSAFRVKTLTASVVPILVGTALIHYEGKNIDWSLSVWALLSALFIQIATNLINDVLDFKKGADTDERLGPKRVTQSGLISSRGVMLGAGVCFLLAFLCGVPLVLKGGMVLIAIGLVSLFCAYIYTGGPYPLAYYGLGDLFVFLFFGVVAVGGVYYVHTLEYSWSAVVAGSQVGLLCTVLIVINNLRDMEQDQKVNKKTLAVRMGKKWSRLEIVILFFICFLMQTYWVWQKAWLVAILPFVVLPLAQKLIKDIIKNEPGLIYNQFLARSSLIHILFGVQISLGFILQ